MKPVAAVALNTTQPAAVNLKPIFAVAKRCVAETPQTSRIVFAEGEDERVLRAVQIIIDEHSGRILVDSSLAEEEKQKMESLFASI